MFSFGNDFAGSRGHTQGICSTFGPWYIALDQSFLENFAIAEKISIFQEQGSQRIAEKYAKDCRNLAGGRINTRRILGAESLPRGSEVET